MPASTSRRAKAAGVPPRRCRVCFGELRCGQPGQHWSCADICPGCHRPVVLDEQRRRHNCDCTKTALKAAATSD